MTNIAELRTKLRVAQEQKTEEALSERLCVEILLDLARDGSVSGVWSVDGQDFVTYEKLDVEIKEQLQYMGGRASKSEIAQALEISQDVVDVRLERLFLIDATVHFVRGSVMTSQYLDGVAEGVEMKLQEGGLLRLETIVEKTALPAGFLRSQLEMRLGTIIKGSFFDHMTIISPIFSEKVRAAAFGTILGATCPISASSVASTFGFPHVLVEAEFRNLEKLGLGTWDKKRSEFFPIVYLKEKAEEARNFYEANFYIKSALLKRLTVEDATALCADALDIGTFKVAPYFVELIRAHVQDALVGHSWFDVRSHCPPDMDTDEMKMLVENCLNGNVGGGVALIHENSIVVSKTFLDDVVASLSSKIDTIAAASLAKEAPASTAAVSAPATGKKNKTPKTAKKDSEPELRVLEIDVATFDSVANDEAIADWRESLVAELMPRMRSAVEAKMAELEAQRLASCGGSAGRVQRQKLLNVDLPQEFEIINLHVSCLETLRVVSDSRNPLVAHVCRRGVALGDSLLTLIMEDLTRSDKQLPVVTSKNRKQIISKLKEVHQAEASTVSQALVSAFESRNPTSVLEHLQDLGNSCGAFLRAPDKKRRRAVISARKAELTTQIQTGIADEGQDVMAASIELNLIEAGLYFEVPKNTWAFEAFKTILPKTLTEDETALLDAIIAEDGTKIDENLGRIKLLLAKRKSP